jgi:hypothetical protein
MGHRNRVNIYITINGECLHITGSGVAEPSSVCVGDSKAAGRFRFIQKAGASPKYFLLIFYAIKGFFCEYNKQ